MITGLFKTKKFYLVIIILIATSGSIFFFPMNIGGKYTCYYQGDSNICLKEDHDTPAMETNHISNLGTGTRSRALSKIILGVTSSISASCLTLILCSVLECTKCLMSSGITKSRPSSRASTLEHL